MSYKLEWEPQGVTRRHTGHVNSREIMNAITEVAASSQFDDLRFIISDYLAATSFEIAPVDLEECLAIESASKLVNPRISIAVVSTAPEVIVTVQRYTSDPDFAYPRRIFPTLAEARAWLHA